MAKIYFCFIALLLLSSQADAQVASDYAVQLMASTQTSPPQITLQWKKLTGATSYIISRKAKTATTWSNLATAPASDSTYTDASVIVDSAYEYMVTNTGGVTATGYIYAGIKAPAIHTRGTMILLVDLTFRDSCKSQIATLMNDLRGDGWAVIRHDISRSASVVSVRNTIIADYTSRPNVNGLLLLGHIPVPYSGDLNPDGHPDHLGAWATDAYYADVDGTWTDFSVNDTLASRLQNRNKPGDGKFDQTVIPSNVELQTGRIDFANMPAITKTEFQLMRAYLNKAHTYKIDSLPVSRKGLVDDNFGAFSGEAFAANAYRMFPTLVGTSNIVVADYETLLKDSAYQWSYGCGGGSYTSAGGIGNTVDFNTNAVKGIFSMMFGSYFGDFDASNNFLRAPLCAQEPALTNCWAGRPNWFMHHMALGEPIGYTALLTQNNSYLYTPVNYGGSWVHVALMGDPSLRTNYVKQVTGVVVTPVANAGANISWNGSPEPQVIGYYVYRSDSAWGTYAKISPLITATGYTDKVGTNGKKFYQVRPVKLQQTPSGSYYNLGLGTMVDSALVTFPAAVPAFTAVREVAVFPNPASTRLNAVVDGTSPCSATFTLMNATGAVLSTQTMALHTGENTFSWDVSSYPAGLYTLAVRTANGVIVKKWLKVEGK
jgi:hypothetical protein